MEIVWDERKRLINLANRGLDFAELDPDFFATARVEAARAGRRKAVGHFQGAIITVIFRPLGSEGLSIISMRRASRNERKSHGQET